MFNSAGVDGKTVDRQPQFAKLVGHEVVPCDGHEAVRTFSSDVERVVGSDFVGRVFINTVFLSINHQFDDDGPPLWFETMVFYRGDEVEQRRHPTWNAARLYHVRRYNYYLSPWVRFQLLLAYLFVGSESFVKRLRGDRDD